MKGSTMLAPLLSRLAAAAGALAALAARADTAPAPAPAGPSLMPLLFGLVAVLALIPAAAWLARRSGFAPRAASSGLRVVGQLALGPRERVVIVEAGDRRLLLGVSPAGITRLGTLPPGEPAADGAPGTPAGGRFADVIKRFTSAP